MLRGISSLWCSQQKSSWCGKALESLPSPLEGVLSTALNLGVHLLSKVQLWCRVHSPQGSHSHQFCLVLSLCVVPLPTVRLGDSRLGELPWLPQLLHPACVELPLQRVADACSPGEPHIPWVPQ